MTVATLERTGWRTLDSAAAAADTAGSLVYAVGDIHGCYDPFVSLLDAIAVDAAAQTDDRTAVLILCGDYVDRGPRSADVLEAICWLRRDGPFEVHALIGNHERALLDFIADPLAHPGWLRWGGEETLRAYGVTPPEEGDLRGRLRARDGLLERMPAAHLRLLETLEPMVEIGGYAFVHAGIRPGRPLAEQSLDDLLWIRGDFLDHDGALPRVIVHGHSWRDAAPDVRANRIGIDTGAFATDTLTVLRLDGRQRSYMQTGPDTP